MDNNHDRLIDFLFLYRNLCEVLKASSSSEIGLYSSGWIFISSYVPIIRSGRKFSEMSLNTVRHIKSRIVRACSNLTR